MDNFDSANQTKLQGERFRQEQRVAVDQQAEERQRIEEQGRNERSTQEQRRREEDSRREDQRRQDDYRRDDQRRQDDNRRDDQRRQDERRGQEDERRRVEQQRQESNRRQESQRREQGAATEAQTQERAAKTLYEKSKENERMQSARDKDAAHTPKPDQAEVDYRRAGNLRDRPITEPGKTQSERRIQPEKATKEQNIGQKESPDKNLISLQTRVLNDEARKNYAEYNTKDRGDYKDKPAPEPDKAQSTERSEPGGARVSQEAKSATRDRSPTENAAKDKSQNNESPAMMKYQEHKQAIQEKVQARIEAQSQGQTLSQGR